MRDGSNNIIFFCFCSGGGYADLKRHIEEQRSESPLTDNQDSLQEPEVKRQRQEQHYETE